MEEKKTKRGNGRPPGGHGRVALQKKLAEVKKEREEQERLEAANVLSSLSSLVFTSSKTPAENQGTLTDSNGDIDSSIAKTRPLTQSAAGIPSVTAPSGGLPSWATVAGGSGARSLLPTEQLQRLEDVKNNLILAQLQSKLNLMIQARPSAPKQAPKQVDKTVGNLGSVAVIPCSVAIRPRENPSPKVKQSGGPIVPSVVQTAESRKHHVAVNPVQLLTINKSVADALRARQGLKRQTSKDFEFAPEIKRQHLEKEPQEVNATSEEADESRESSPFIEVEKLASDSPTPSGDKKKDATDTNLPLKKRRLVSAVEPPVSSLSQDSTLISSTLPSNRLTDLSSAAQIENILKMSRDYATPVSYRANSLITGVTATAISNMKPQPAQGYRPIMFDPRTSLRVLSDVKVALTPDGDGDLPIHIAVVHENTELVKKFIDIMAMSGKSVDRYNKLQQTPLHLAVLVNKPDIVSALLLANANPNLVDRNGHTCVHIAVNKQFHDCLFTLFRYTNCQCVMNGRNYEGYPPLHTCVELNDIRAMEFLLQRGADVNIQEGKAGRTVVFYATEYNRANMVDLLIQYGANMELQNYAGISAMMTAQAGNYVDIAHALQRVLDEQKLPEDLQYSRKMAMNKIRKTPLIGISDNPLYSRSMSQDVKSAPVSRRSSSSSNHSPIDLSINRSTTSPFQEQSSQYKQSSNGAEQKIKLERDKPTSSIIKEKHTQLIAALEGRQVTGNSNENKIILPNGKLQPVAGIVTNGDKVINLTEENWRLLSNISEGQGSGPAIRIKEEPTESPSGGVWYSRPVNGSIEVNSTSDSELPSDKSVQETSHAVDSDEDGCDATESDSRNDINDSENAVEPTVENGSKKVDSETECDDEDHVGNSADNTDTRTESVSLRDDDDETVENTTETKSSKILESSDTSSDSCSVTNQELEQKKLENKSITTIQDHSEKFGDSNSASNKDLDSASDKESDSASNKDLDSPSNKESEQKILSDSTNADTSVTAGDVDVDNNVAVNLGSSTPPSPTSLEKEETMDSNDDVPMEDVDSPEMPVLSRVSSISLMDECSEVITGETGGEATTIEHITKNNAEVVSEKTGETSTLEDKTDKTTGADEAVSEIQPHQESISLKSSISLESSHGFDVGSQERKSRQSNDSEMEEIREEDENKVNDSDSSMEIENDIEDARNSIEVCEKKETVKCIETSESCDGIELMETDDEERNLVIDEGISESEDNDKKNILGIKGDVDKSRISQEDKTCENDSSDTKGASELDTSSLVKTSDKDLTTSSHRKVITDSGFSEDIADECSSSRPEPAGNLTSSPSTKVESVSKSQSNEGTEKSQVKSVCSKSGGNVTDASKHSGKTSPAINSSCSSPANAEKPGDNSLSSAQNSSATAKATGKPTVPVQMPTKSKSLGGMDQLFKTGQSHTLYFRDGQGYKPIRIVIDDSEQSSAVIKRLFQASMAQLNSGLPAKNDLSASLNVTGSTGVGASIVGGSKLISGVGTGVSASKVTNTTGHTSTSTVANTTGHTSTSTVANTTGHTSALKVTNTTGHTSVLKVGKTAGHTVTSLDLTTSILSGPSRTVTAIGGISRGKDVRNVTNIGPSKQSLPINHAAHSKEKQNVAHENTIINKLIVKDRLPVNAATSVSVLSDHKTFVSLPKMGLPVMQNSSGGLVDKSMQLNRVPNIDTNLTKVSETGIIHTKMVPYENIKGSNAFDLSCNAESVQKKLDREKDKVETKDFTIAIPHSMMKQAEVVKGGSFNKKPVKGPNSSDERIGALAFMEAHKKGFYGKVASKAELSSSKSMPNLYVPTAKKVGGNSVGSFSKPPGVPPSKIPTPAYEGTITRVNPDIKSKLSKALQSPQRRLGQGRPAVEIDPRYPNIYGIAGNSGEIAAGSVNSKIAGETRQQL